MSVFPHDLPSLTVHAPGLERAHAALKALITEASGVGIPERRHIVLIHGDTTIASITITDESVWSEFAKDMGFQP